MHIGGGDDDLDLPQQDGDEDNNVASLTGPSKLQSPRISVSEDDVDINVKNTSHCKYSSS